MTPVTTRGEARHAALHLTFDDGPDPVHTPRVLAALRRAGAQATFFVLGECVRAHPRLVDGIRDAGHRLELHGDAHLDHRTASPEELAADTAAALNTLERAGILPSWWRLPWGRPGPATAAIADREGLSIVHWNMDTHDWRGDGPAEQPAGFGAVASGGGVVLLHDGVGPGADRAHVDNTIGLIDRATALALRAGTPVCALPGVHDAAAAPIPRHAPPSMVAA